MIHVRHLHGCPVQKDCAFDQLVRVGSGSCFAHFKAFQFVEDGLQQTHLLARNSTEKTNCPELHVGMRA